MPKKTQTIGREIVLGERSFCEKEKAENAPLIPFLNVRQRVAAMTGKSEKTVSTITKEDEIAAFTSEKIQNKQKKIILEDFNLCAIKNKIHELYSVRKEVPTLRKPLAELNVDINFKGGFIEISTTYLKRQIASINVGRQANNVVKLTEEILASITSGLSKINIL